MKTILQRWGNSQGIRIPKSIIDCMGLGVGSEVTIEVSQDHSEIKITPSRDSRPVHGRYRIEDLIASSSPTSFEGEHDWGSPQGSEIW